MNPMYWRFRHKVERMKLSALVWCELHPSPSSPNSTSYYNETLHVCGYYSNIVLYLWKVIWQFFFKFSFSNLYNKDILLMEKKNLLSENFDGFFEFLVQNCWNLGWIFLLQEALGFYHLHPHISYLVACLYKKQIKCWKIEVAWEKKINKYSLDIWIV